MHKAAFSGWSFVTSFRLTTPITSQTAKSDKFKCEAVALLDSYEVDRIETHPVIFDGLTGNLIRRTALRTHGSAGPPGLDSSAWQRMCTAFRKAADDLCLSMALVARRICREDITDKSIGRLCRLQADSPRQITRRETDRFW